MKNETLIESFNTDNNDVQENITKIKKPNNKNNSSKCIYRLFHNLLFSLYFHFLIFFLSRTNLAKIMCSSLYLMHFHFSTILIIILLCNLCQQIFLTSLN